MRTKTRIGSSLAAVLLALIAACVGQGKDKRSPEPHAVIAGTAFRPPGFVLPGAKVKITPEAGAFAGVKLKTAEAQTDTRGEFAIRVPVVPMKWTVHVQASGYQAQAKTVQIEGEQRVETTFQLEPAPGKSKGEIK